MENSLDPDLIELAAASGGLLTAGQLSASGRSRKWQSDARRGGLLHRPSRGIYVVAERWKSLPAWHRYELWVRGVGLTWVEPYAGTRALSHQSAAVLWGLPLVGAPGEAHLVDVNGAARRSRDGVRIHHSDLAEGIARRAGLRVTSIHRTIVDCCAVLDYAGAVALADAALAVLLNTRGPDGRVLRGRDFDVRAQEGQKTILLDLLWRRRPTGAHSARKAILFADARSESAAESKARAIFRLLGFPKPELQLPVRTTGGTFYPDFAFPTAGVLAEIDGAVKTREPSNGDASASVERERRRHILLQEQGWEIARFTWADLQDQSLVRAKLDAAFARARHRGLSG